MNSWSAASACELRFYSSEFFHLLQRSEEGDFLPHDDELEVQIYSGRARASGALELRLERAQRPDLELEFRFVPVPGST